MADTPLVTGPDEGSRPTTGRFEPIVARAFLLLVRILDAVFPLRLGTLRGRLESIAHGGERFSVDGQVEAETGHLHEIVRPPDEPDDMAPRLYGELLLDLAKWTVEREEDRTSTIDSKSGTVAAAAGTVLTIAFGLLALARPDKWTAETSVLVTVLVSSGLFALVASLAYATHVALVRASWRGMGQGDLFHEELLSNPVRHRSYLAIHLWKLYRASFHTNDSRAQILRRAQVLFTLGATLLGAVGILFALGA